MARKNVFEIAADPAPAPDDTDRPLAKTRPLAGFEKPVKRAGAVGAISQSLEGMSDKVNRAAQIEKLLVEGHAVIDLDPALIDGSIVIDRLGVSAEDQQALVDQIREHGQQVPILVRPHPDIDGRYQVAYGHRRLAAVKTIGGPVKAVVRALSDEQLVVSQGQENNSRTDLSFIERAYFAFKLEDRRFGRDTIMSALGVDKAALSRMIALVSRLPQLLIEAIGPAPGFGRQRWAELADLLEDATKSSRALALVGKPDFAALSSDGRFLAVYNQLKTTMEKPRTAIWKTEAGQKTVRISETDDRLSLSFDKQMEPAFGAFVEARLPALYAAFKRGDAV